MRRREERLQYTSARDYLPPPQPPRIDVRGCNHAIIPADVVRGAARCRIDSAACEWLLRMGSALTQYLFLLLLSRKKLRAIEGRTTPKLFASENALAAITNEGLEGMEGVHSSAPSLRH